MRPEMKRREALIGLASGAGLLAAGEALAQGGTRARIDLPHREHG